MNRVVLKVAALTSTTLLLISAPNPRGSYPVTCVNSLKNMFYSFVFVVYDQVSISSFQPLFGSPGTRVLITLSNPFESNSMICRFDQYIDQPAMSWNATTIACIIPALSKISVSIEVSMDGISYAIANAAFKIVTVGSILNKLSPSTSPVSGGIPVIIYGDDFQSALLDTVYCSFGGFQVQAKKLSTSSISCSTPAIKDPSLVSSVMVFSGSTQISSELPFAYTLGYSVTAGYIKPTVQIIGVQKVSESGFVDPVITIFGISFNSYLASSCTLDGVNALSIANPIPSKWTSNYVECTFPFSALQPRFQVVSWKVTGSDFSSSFSLQSISKPVVSSFTPSILSLNGGQYLTLSGTNVGSFATARCTVGGFLCAFQSSLSTSDFVCNPMVSSLSDSVPIIFSPVAGVDINVGNVRIVNATLRVLRYESIYSGLGTSIQLYGLNFPDLLMTCLMCDNTIIL